MARRKQSRAQKRAKHQARHDRRDSRGGARYAFADINRSMGMNPRRKKRRNPGQFPMPFASALNPRRRGHKRRNPSGMERTLKDGTSLSLHEEGSNGVLYVNYASGEMDSFKLPWKKAVAKFKAFKSGKKYSRRSEASAWRELAMDNPRRRKGRGRKSRGRKSRGRNPMVEDPRWAVTRIMRKGSKRNCGMGRNPAQFPMPFASAMNPRRTRRNYPISRKQARVMGKVLRQHGYKKCKTR